MKVVVAILYLAAVILIVLAALGVSARVSLALLAAGLALLAFSLSAIVDGLSG